MLPVSAFATREENRAIVSALVHRQIDVTLPSTALKQPLVLCSRVSLEIESLLCDEDSAWHYGRSCYRTSQPAFCVRFVSTLLLNLRFPKIEKGCVHFSQSQQSIASLLYIILHGLFFVSKFAKFASCTTKLGKQNKRKNAGKGK